PRCLDKRNYKRLRPFCPNSSRSCLEIGCVRLWFKPSPARVVSPCPEKRPAVVCFFHARGLPLAPWENPPVAGHGHFSSTSCPERLLTGRFQGRWTRNFPLNPRNWLRLRETIPSSFRRAAPGSFSSWFHAPGGR